MKRSAKLATAAVVALTCRPVDGRRRRAAGTKKSADKAAAAKPETYDVVKIGDEVQIIRKSDLASLRKSTAEEDKKAKKEYDDGQEGR